MNLIMNSSLENAEVDLASEMAVDKSAWEECWLGAQSGWWSFFGFEHFDDQKNCWSVDSKGECDRFKLSILSMASH